MQVHVSKVMGILNVTPDSFYDGGKTDTIEKAIEKGIKLYKEGADILDIGGESSRPGAIEVSVQEELSRVLPVIKALRSEIPIPLSIDTTKPAVAEAAIREGVTMINDISGFRDPQMTRLAASSHVEICAVHMHGTPKTMQLSPYYEEGIIRHLLDWFKRKTTELLDAGIKQRNIIIDPGIGFGKTVDDNLKILHNLQDFKAIGFRVLLGLSRKSFLTHIIHKPSAEVLAPTIAMNTIALLAKTDIIRVHDVREHRDVADVLEKYNGLYHSDLEVGR